MLHRRSNFTPLHLPLNITSANTTEYTGGDVPMGGFIPMEQESYSVENRWNQTNGSQKLHDVSPDEQSTRCIVSAQTVPGSFAVLGLQYSTQQNEIRGSSCSWQPCMRYWSILAYSVVSQVDSLLVMQNIY